MTRLLTAVALLALAFYLIFWAPPALFLAAAAVFGVLCYIEFSGLIEAHGIKRPDLLGMLGGAVVICLPRYALVVTMLVTLAAFLRSLSLPSLKDVPTYVGSVVLGIVYTFAPWSFAVELRKQSVHILFFALALNWAGDSIAYYVGRRFGKHKLAPRVSPGKSREGAVASVLGSVVFGVLYLRHFAPWMHIWEVAVVAAAANVMGQCGDLAESAIKRGAGVKDSGGMLPGHGGMLDRLDSSLFALPVVYALFLILP